MGKYQVKCSNCGYKKMSNYLHDVCPRCNGSMHHDQEKSLYQAIKDKDNKLIKSIEKRANAGQIVRII